MKYRSKILVPFLFSIFASTTLFAPKADAIMFVAIQDTSPEAGFAMLACFIPPIIVLLPLCLLGEDGSGTNAPTKEMLLENGYTDEQATALSNELAAFGQKMEEKQQSLQFEKNDEPQKVASLTGLSPEAAKALLEISGR